jgi:hypothetical protein
MRSPHSSKWREAMEDEMRSMSANQVWKLEKISKEAKTVSCKWSTKLSVTPKRISIDLRQN